MKKTVLIFDMDGVLVEPVRYRAALKATLDYFGRRMGWDSLFPGEETIAWFESRGIISEWDIAPLYLAAVFESILNSSPNLCLPADLLSACETVKQPRITKFDIDCKQFIQRIPIDLTAGRSICDTAFQLQDVDHKNPVFPKLSETALLASILLNSRNVHTNIIICVFQEMCLGKSVFEDTFRKPVTTEFQPAEQVFDRQLISPEWKNRLKQENSSGTLYPVIYTARPSSPGTKDANGDLLFSPEADIVVNQLGWQKIPLVGLGQLHFAAKQIGCSSFDMIKPSPVHALGAIGAALFTQPLPAILAAWDINKGIPNSYFDDISELDVHVFEDSPTGTSGVIQAVQCLNSIGKSIKLSKWGITSDANKKNSLLELGAIMMPTVNDALDAVLDKNYFF